MEEPVKIVHCETPVNIVWGQLRMVGSVCRTIETMQSDDQLVLWSKFYHVSKESSVSLEMPTSHFKSAARMLTVISVWTLKKVLAEKGHK